MLGSANRGKKKTGRVVGRGVSQEIEPTPLPHFDRPAWESADTGTRGAEKNNSSQVPRLNGFDEKELAAVLLSAVAQMPRPKVSPATACANDLIKKLQYAQKHHLLDLGVPVSGDGNSSTDALLSLDPLVLRAARLTSRSALLSWRRPRAEHRCRRKCTIAGINRFKGATTRVPFLEQDTDSAATMESLWLTF